MDMKPPDITFTRVVIFVNAVVPLVLLAWDAFFHHLGANPVEFATRTTGVLTLICLFVSLAVTPLRQTLGANWLIKFRRMLGLFAFFYGCLHLLTYIWFDKFFHLSEIVQDTLKRPFIFVGMASWLLLVPLAITSTNAMIKRLGGKRWQRLHRVVYLIAIGGVFHYWLIVKADARIPYTFAAVLAVLLGYRLVKAMNKSAGKRPMSVMPR
ncbi:MAG: sulfoxide reductase heme-binding subunit YedZ [Acidobacteria bacterium]|nr:MAG: sulfoxide reductase heme-binding subunit YedZ [Acidobacteriota bacterium]